MGECVLMPPVAKILMSLSNMHVLFLSVRVLGSCVFIQRGLHCLVCLTRTLVLLEIQILQNCCLFVMCVNTPELVLLTKT